MPQTHEARHILAFDTSGSYVAVALVRGDATVVAAHGAAMARGQAEALFPMCTAVMAEAGVAWPDVSAIAVGIGPGNFTGIRIAVASARGLALSVGVPAIGVTGFEVLVEASGRQRSPLPELFSIAAPRGQVYVQGFAQGAALGAGKLVDPTASMTDFHQVSAVYGHDAQRIARGLGVEGVEPPATDSATQIAQIAAHIGLIAVRKLLRGGSIDAPAPLYLRPSDAAAPSDPPVRVLL